MSGGVEDLLVVFTLVAARLQMCPDPLDALAEFADDDREPGTPYPV